MRLAILAFWIAFLIHMSFGVYLEGPQGGIWFWSVMGLGIAALELQKSIPPPTPVRRAAEPVFRRYASRASA